MNFFYYFLSGHRLFNGHRLIDIYGNLGLGEVGEVSLVDLGVDEDIGWFALATGLDITRKLGILTVGQSTKYSRSDGHELDIRIEGLKILESEGPIQNQSQILSRPSNLGGLGGGGVHIRIVGYGVHYVSNLPEFVAESRVFCNFLQKSFG